MKSFDLKLKKGSSNSKIFTIRNGGGGILTGTIEIETKPGTKWLKIPPILRSFKLAHNGEQNITFDVDTNGLPYGYKDTGHIKINSNDRDDLVKVNLIVERRRFPIPAIVGLAVAMISGLVFGIMASNNNRVHLSPQNSQQEGEKDSKSTTSANGKAETSDITAPNGSININKGDDYTNKRMVTIDHSTTDNVGITGYYISENPSPSEYGEWFSITPTARYTENVPYTLSSDNGNKTVYVRYKDASGNISEVASDSIALDTIAPSGSLSIREGNSYTNSRMVTLSLKATDNSGITGYCITEDISPPSLSGDNWSPITSTTNFIGSIPFTSSNGDGNKWVYVWYKDAAGNISSATTDSITLDTTAPSIRITKPTSSSYYATTSNNIDIGGDASDSIGSANGSGIDSIIITWNNRKEYTWKVFGTVDNWYLRIEKLPVGRNTLTVTATDMAGNPSSDTITVDYTDNWEESANDVEYEDTYSKRKK